MKTFWLLPTLLIFTFLSGCTVVHKHYHYYHDDSTSCLRSATCDANAPHQRQDCNIHGMDHHGPEQQGNHGMHHRPDKHGDMHGMMQEKMKHLQHGKKGILPRCGAGCPCGCQQGEKCDCPRADEDLEGLFSK